MNLLLINYEFPPIGGGAGRATASIAREMALLGHDVRVLTARYRGLADRERVDGYTVIRTPALRREIHQSTPLEMISFMLGALPRAIREAHRSRPDLSIAFFGLPSGPVAYALRVLAGIPYVVSLRGGDVPGSEATSDVALYYQFTRPVIRFLWRQAAAVVANSEGLRALAQRTMPDRPVQVIPNGIDLAYFPVSDLTLHGEPPKLLFVGRVVRQKGLDCLLEALALLDVPFTLEIVGDGPDRPMFEAQAARLNLGNRVAFTGWLPVDQVISRYGAADILVLPSLGEGMSNVVLEAMGCGLPIVGTDIPGNSELIVPGKNGFLVPLQNAAALAQALRTLLVNRTLRQQMGLASRSRAESYQWRRTAESYLALSSRCQRSAVEAKT